MGGSLRDGGRGLGGLEVVQVLDSAVDLGVLARVADERRAALERLGRLLETRLPVRGQMEVTA